MRQLLVILSLGLALAGCSRSPEQPATEGQDQPPTLSQAPASEAAQPISLRIPSVGIDSMDPNWLPLGVQGQPQGDRTVPVTPPGEAGQIEVPPLDDPLKLGFYCPDGFPVCGSPVPGQPGPTVVVGHVNGNHKDGIFAKLRQVKVGDKIFIGRKDDRTVTYHVTRVSEPLKTAFPTQEVYGDTKIPALRLITCGGGSNALEHTAGGASYVNQTIVFADQDSVSKTP